MDGFGFVLDEAGRALWEGPATVLILICGLYFTIRGRFFQLTGFGKCLRMTVGSVFRKEKTGVVSSFQTACTALAGTLGTGNIVGVAAAISAGGAGAVFWMWMAALLGMATACAENVLGMLYRKRDGKGQWTGGAMGCMERGLRCRPAAVVYSLLTVLAAFSVGSLTQINSISASALEAFGLNRLICGIAVAALAAPAVLGGVKGAARLSERLVPFMAGLYVLVCAAVIAFNIRRLPEAFLRIFREAFTPSAAGGGALGSLIVGVRRGAFSNEAGLGTSVAVHCAADGATPEGQGRWAMFEVFFDTVFVCGLTALALLTGSPEENSLTEAFSPLLGRLSGGFVALCLLLFAFATIIAWSIYGERAFCMLFGAGSGIIFRLLFLLSIIPGSVMRVRTAWAAADFINALLAILNTLCLLLLSKKALREICSL